jgi:hypothetical protein
MVMASLGWEGIGLSWNIGSEYLIPLVSRGLWLDPKQPLPSPLEISGSSKDG